MTANVARERLVTARDTAKSAKALQTGINEAAAEWAAMPRDRRGAAARAALDE